ncbi:MAG: hypothetical protein IKS99_02390 [Firmicutes bacterium]|nr:hypothetical protein [Bacillota bacterium]
MILQLIEEELTFEKQQLLRILSYLDDFPDFNLTETKGGFCYRRNGDKRRIYINKSDWHLLWQITSKHYLKQKAKALRTNIPFLEKALASLVSYDDEAIISNLPKTYRKAIDLLRRDSDSSTVAQSENAFRRGDLKLTASNGLKVRSREELAIVELLLAMDINFRYEKALTLHEKVYIPDGTFIIKETTVYPDFTITLADGSLYYIEHCGMLDNGDYRNAFFRKLNLYFDNGIYSPKNLLISMAGPDMPFDVASLRRTLLAQVVPFI